MQRIWLLGNTADVSPDAPFFTALRQFAAASEDRVHLLVNGDLISDCREGTPAEAQIQALLDVVKGLPRVRMTLIPGDRDWSNSGPDGWECVRAIEKFVKSRKLENVEWAINKGCPGPEEIEIHPQIVLLALNTQWWNHPYRKPRAADSDCDLITEYDILEEIQDDIEDNKDRNILMAGHFPFLSFGKYGGYFPPKTHFLPPLWGSIKVAYHKHVGNQKDIINQRFQQIGTRMESIASAEENILFLSAHEHNQQIIFYEDNYLLNSGAPVKADFAADDRSALLSRSDPGFLEIAYYPDGAVHYIFQQFDGQGFMPAQQGPLFQSPCRSPAPGIPVNDIIIPCAKPMHTPIEPNQITSSSVMRMAGPRYAAGGLKRFFLGPHYRETWTTPVRVPVMSMDSTFGGLFVLKKGGGRQTKSLKLRTSDGYRYVFRSVDKNPVKALDYDLQQTVIATVTRDQTSSEHPYGALVIAPLLDTLGILHATPKLYVMPDDPRLGPYRPQFSGMLGMLEEHPADVDPGEPSFAGADEILKSYELYQELYEHQDHRIDVTEFSRARILDILVGDWSKHEDNWKWAGYEKGEGMYYRPIPRDRDHVFSNLDGLIPWLADRPFGIPNIENFGRRIADIRSLTFQARHMDRLLTNELNREDWLDAARFVRSRITPEMIHESVRTLPPEAYEVSGKELETKLEIRRQDLEKYADQFYRLLAKEVDVVGTNEPEYFKMTRLQDGRSQVQVFGVEKSDSSLIYERIFHPDETKEIRLYGLGGDDVFQIEGRTLYGIKTRVIGGPGTERIQDYSIVGRGGKKTFIYERDEDSQFSLGKEARRIKSWNDRLYYYDRTAFEYNTYFPIAYIGFRSFNGVTIGAGIDFTRHNYAKPDFSSKHSFRAGISTIGNFSAEYRGRFRHFINRWDALVGITYAKPENYNFFFGLGNESIKNDELFDDRFYQINYNSVRVNLGLRQDFWKKSFASLHIGYEYNNTVDEEDNILSEGDFFGTGPLNLYKLLGELEIDLRDHRVFPTQGFRFRGSQELGIINEEAYGISDVFMEYFASTRRRPVTVGLRGGYSNSFNDVPFYKLPSLGQEEGLRGFQRNRFVGKGRLYFNSELRVHLAKLFRSLLPLEVGLRGFYDRGKILQPDENVGEWHEAYGGGFYVVPLSRNYTFSLLVGFSEEETGLINLNFGTNF